MDRAGAVRLNAREVDALTAWRSPRVGEGEHKHDVPAKEFLGQDAAVLARGDRQASARRRPNCCSARRTSTNPFVPVEQMMPFVPFVRVPRRRRGDREGEVLRARLPPHEHHPFEQRAEHDQDGPSDGHDAVRQERPVHGVAGAGRRRLFVVFDRHADRRGRHDAADVHPRTPLLADRRFADFGSASRSTKYEAS